MFVIHFYDLPRSSAWAVYTEANLRALFIAPIWKYSNGSTYGTLVSRARLLQKLRTCTPFSFSRFDDYLRSFVASFRTVLIMTQWILRKCVSCPPPYDHIVMYVGYLYKYKCSATAVRTGSQSTQNSTRVGKNYSTVVSRWIFAFLVFQVRGQQLSNNDPVNFASSPCPVLIRSQHHDVQSQRTTHTGTYRYSSAFAAKTRLLVQATSVILKRIVDSTQIRLKTLTKVNCLDWPPIDPWSYSG
jgi:hypothetical protein